MWICLPSMSKIDDGGGRRRQAWQRGPAAVFSLSLLVSPDVRGTDAAACYIVSGRIEAWWVVVGQLAIMDHWSQSRSVDNGRGCRSQETKTIYHAPIILQILRCRGIRRLREGGQSKDPPIQGGGRASHLWSGRHEQQRSPHDGILPTILYVLTYHTTRAGSDSRATPAIHRLGEGVSCAQPLIERPTDARVFVYVYHFNASTRALSKPLIGPEKVIGPSPAVLQWYSPLSTFTSP